ncbi:sodium- and chloride-dependent betaine transporter-like [Diretmus argenteus]
MPVGPCCNAMIPGIGYGQLIIRLYGFSYVIVQAWALLYLVFSFSSQLPWVSCDNTWNTADCVDSSSLAANWTSLTNTSSAAVEFWQRRALAMSAGIEELGSLRWDLAMCLLVSWVFCYFCIWKGVKSSGKAAYFTATFPYVMLLVLLVRGSTLPGAWDGIHYYLYPDLSRLADSEIWIEAGSQIFFSYSLGAGALIVLGSYSEKNNNFYNDTFWLCLLNSGTSFVAGFVVFSVLGFMAQKHGVSVDMVAELGPGLAFIAYPQATAMMPFPQFWTVCFFLMLMLLTVDTHFVSVECFITSVKDLFPKHFHTPGRHEIFVLFVCSSVFLCKLMLATQGGVYIFLLFDYYGCSRAVLYFMAAFECLAVSWIFDVRYLYLVNLKQLRINRSYVYPDWAYALGWILSLSSIIMVPLWGIGQICFTTGTLRQRLSSLCHPVNHPADRTTEDAEASVDMMPLE